MERTGRDEYPWCLGIVLRTDGISMSATLVRERGNAESRSGKGSLGRTHLLDFIVTREEGAPRLCDRLFRLY